jgi:hypothetical protein
MMNPDHERRPTVTQLLELPIIKKVAQKRMVKIRWHQSVDTLKSLFSSAVTALCYILLFNFFHDMISKLSGKSQSLPKSVPGRKLLPHKHSSVDWDMSFSDNDPFEDSFSVTHTDVFESSQLSQDDDPLSLVEPGTHKKIVRRIPLNSTPTMDRKQALLNHSPFIPCTSPHFSSGRRGKKTSSSQPLELSLSDSPSLLRDSRRVSKSSVSAHNFCDFSDDDEEEENDHSIDLLNLSGSSIGPKNLLSVFESMESEEGEREEDDDHK